MVRVSVLVAVYNASPFLRCCLDSLLAQTMPDFEAICVDDSSTDDSADILEAYAARDARFVVIHLGENQGQAHARNVGLQRAQGAYICMLDADDWLSPDALQLAVDAMESESQKDVDSVLFEVSKDDETNATPYAIPPYDTLTGEEAFRLSLTWQIHGLYMVRADIHRRFPYDETCRLYSDDNTTRLHYLSSRRVGRCAGIYHYRQHSGSATHAVSVRRFDYLRANLSMRQTLLQLKVSTDVLALYENHRWLNLVGVYMFYYVHGRELTNEERLYGLSELRRAWKGIDRRLLDAKTICKFGYYPMPSWTLFLLEEWLYFSLRSLFGKNY